jgi:nitroreductase
MKSYPDNVEHDFSVREPVPAGLDSVIAHRYSPRAFKNHVLDEDAVNLLFEAARHAPSCFNAQPWKFYASSPKSFADYLEFLVPQNAEWAKDASLIFVVTAAKNFSHNDKPNAHSWFDSGAAWFALAYQARKMGLYTHAMAGIEKQKIIDELKIPPSHEVICAVAVGVIDDTKASIEEITPRKELAEILSITR